MTRIVELQGVVARAGQRTLVEGIDLAVEVGERVAIVGANGAGKSSLLKLISGQLAPHAGSVTVLGRFLHERATREERRRFHAEVGVMHQGLHLVQRLSALDNALLGCLGRCRSPLTWLRIFPKGEVARALAALEAVGIGGQALERVDRLSGGQRQKVALARVLQQAPRLLLADEPTAALDPSAAREVAMMLSTVVQSQGMTLISVVHDPDMLPLLADRAIGIAAGRVAFDLPLSRLEPARLDALYRSGQATPGSIAPAEPVILGAGG